MNRMSSIEERFGAEYFNVLSKSTNEFFQAFNLSEVYLENVEVEGVDADGERVLILKGESLTLVFKMKNEFAPLHEFKRSEINIVVDNKLTSRLPQQFNIRLTNTENSDSFNVNSLEVILNEDSDIDFGIEEKFNFWTMLAF